MLSDKVCIVTGAGHGIGESVAIELGKHGATVVANDIGGTIEGIGEDEEPAESTASEIKSAGGEAVAHFGDVASLSYTNQLIADTVEKYGRVDGIVNFAGIMRNAPIYEMTEEEWDLVIRVHLRGHYAMLRSASAHWHEQFEAGELETQRSFLCVASRSAMGRENQVNYSAGKAGVLGIARAAARELFEFNIRVNALMPSAKTRLTDYVYGAEAQESAGRPEPQDVAPLVGYLLSDEAEDIAGWTFRAVGDSIGLVSDPEIFRLGYREDGWTPEAVAERLREDVAGGIDLTKIDPAY